MLADTQLHHDLVSKLKSVTNVPPGQLAITAKNGIVTLAGRVGSQKEKWSVVHATERVAGVRAIVSDLHVALCSDEEIARGILHALNRDLLLSKQAVKVHVRHGWVTLRGTVNRIQQRAALEEAVRNLQGVRGLTSRVTVKPAVRCSKPVAIES